MIHVEARPEPPSFDADVRQPGERALREGVVDLPPHWRKCIPDLLREYSRICAYSCLYIPRVTGSSTVEHYAPKSKARELAYEWSNYRLVCSLMNSRKNDFEDVLDPFEIGDDWFELEFLFMQVRPAAHLDEVTSKRIDETIKRLKLNDEECCAARAEWYEDWKKEGLSAEFMQSRSPFIYREALRQGLAP